MKSRIGSAVLVGILTTGTCSGTVFCAGTASAAVLNDVSSPSATPNPNDTLSTETPPDDATPLPANPGDPTYSTFDPSYQIPMHPVCDTPDKYTISSKSSQFLSKSPTYKIVNNSYSNATHTYAASISSSLSLALSASAGVDVSLVVATVKTSGTATATATITVSGTYSVTGTARPHTTAYLAIGFFREQTNGTYHSTNDLCQTSSKSLTAYTPYYFGGTVWGG